MMRTLSIVVLAATAACGPGRQASWEKESATNVKADEVAAQPSAANRALELWAQREERAALEQAIALWEQTVETNAADPDAWTWLARAYYLMADGHLRADGDDEKLMATFEKGIVAGEKAMMAVSPEFAEKVKAGSKVEEAVAVIPAAGQSAIYWYATNLGKFAVAKGFTTTLFYKDRIFAVMQRVLAIDESFFHGAPHRYFGAFYAKAPSFAGGDLTKSKEHFDKALAIDAKYLATKVLYAEYYATKTEDRELYTKLLTEVEQADPTVLPDLVPEQRIEQTKAKKLLAMADENF